MAMTAVVDAVEARLDALWNSEAAILARAAAGLPGCPVLGINLQGDAPDEGQEFAQVQYPVANIRQMDLAGTVYREEGAIRVIVNAQRGAGVKIGLELSEQLAALFRQKKFDGVQTFTPSSPIMDDRNDNGLYYPVSFSVEYHHQFRDETGFYA